jgi:anti-sigma B factor antagonist
VKDVRTINFEDLQHLFLDSRPTQEAIEALIPHRSDHEAFLKDLLRWHGDFAVSNAREIRRRFSFDCLLNFYGILEVALLACYIPETLPDQFREQALAHLTHPAVERYYERYYPQYLPHLFRRWLNREVDPRDYEVDDRAASIFSGFVGFTTAYEADENIRRFEWFLDDGWSGDYGLPDFLDLLGRPDDLCRVLLQPRDDEILLHQAAQGFYGFLRFCIDLGHLLAQAEKFPVLRAGMWFHYAYWFEILGDKVAAKIKDALSRFLTWEKLGVEVGELRMFVETGSAAVDELTARSIGAPLREAEARSPQKQKATLRRVDGVTIVDFRGHITLGEGASVLHSTVRDLLSRGHKKILLNLRHVDLIDSSGLGELVSAFLAVRKQGGQLKILNLTRKYHDLFSTTKFYPAFDAKDDEASAVQSFS